MKRDNYENRHQKALIKWARLQPEIGERLIHIPNEGLRTKQYGKHLKEMGMVSGCFDLFLAVPTFFTIKTEDLKHHLAIKEAGFWLEMKSPNKKLTKMQENFLLTHQDNFSWGIYYDWISAAKAICDYLGKDYRGI